MALAKKLASRLDEDPYRLGEQPRVAAKRFREVLNICYHGDILNTISAFSDLYEKHALKNRM